jgi:hypothetical protein
VEACQCPSHQRTYQRIWAGVAKGLLRSNSARRRALLALRAIHSRQLDPCEPTPGPLPRSRGRLIRETLGD